MRSQLRTEYILQKVAQEGFLSIPEAAKALGVSMETSAEISASWIETVLFEK